MTTITVNNIEFNVNIDLEFGEIEVFNTNGEKIAFAEVHEDNNKGSYTLYDQEGKGEKQILPQVFCDEMNEEYGTETAYWLCSLTLN